MFKIITLAFILAISASANAEDKKPDAAQAAPAAAKPAEINPKAAPAENFVFNPSSLKEELLYDVSYGNKNAKNKIVEYASLSCIHCKDFHEQVFYKLKESFVDKGDVYFVHRNYPLNMPAMKATKLVECVAKPEDRAVMLGALYKSQSQWAYVASEEALKDRLKDIAKIGGIDEAKFKSCYDDKSIEEKIIENMKRANTELGITGTPTIFLNGVKYEGERTVEAMSIAITGGVSPAAATSTPAPAEAAKPSEKTPEANAAPAKTEEKKQ
jgi:protein-disulfide isomerase